MDRKTMKKIAKEGIPPFIHEALTKLFYRDKYTCRPTWHSIRNGDLKNRQILIDPRYGLWQEDMLEGRYDRFLFDYLKDLPMRGNVVFEIGAHIGFHAMNFAHLVGEDGQVYAFEPNKYNRRRMEVILERNADLASRIKILGVALSDKEGEIIFYFSDDVDKGMSSGSFTSQSHAFYKNTRKYLELFSETKVRAVTLDGINDYLGKEIVPNVIKIDVEDAESSVLEGGLNLIRKTKPFIFVEVHSVFSMFNVSKLLNHLGYTMDLLKEEADGRCFIAAQPPRS
jgi:FkbM family methyltransferase